MTIIPPHLATLDGNRQFLEGVYVLTRKNEKNQKGKTSVFLKTWITDEIDS